MEYTSIADADIEINRRPASFLLRLSLSLSLLSSAVLAAILAAVILVGKSPASDITVLFHAVDQKFRRIWNGRNSNFTGALLLANPSMNITAKDLRSLHGAKLSSVCVTQPDLEQLAQSEETTDTSIVEIANLVAGAKLSWYLSRSSLRGLRPLRNMNFTNETRVFCIDLTRAFGRKDMVSLEVGDIKINVTEIFGSGKDGLTRPNATVCFKDQFMAEHIGDGLLSADETSSRMKNTKLECSCARHVLSSLTTSQQSLWAGLMDPAVLDRAHWMVDLICSGKPRWEVTVFERDQGV
ncbi:hypothetical protein HDU93_002341 [Gonapodya sp. JEL0774]|nr:hypothetical protein HDU93_002341 [Gonapodya sp. JEL0774]